MLQIAVKKASENIFRNNVLPSLMYASEIRDDPEWSHPMHMHKDLSEIVFVREGKGDFIVNNVYYKVQKGDILVYNKGTLHDERSDPDYPIKTYVCGVGNAYIKNAEDGCIIPKDVSPLVKSGKYSQKIENLFSIIFEECSSQDEGFELVIQNVLAALISLIVRAVSLNRQTVNHSPETLGYKIKQYIDENYKKDIKLKDIADDLYISPYYLAHIFKKEIGFSPIQYLINRRIGEAQNLLLTTDMPVSEISKSVGYDNTNYFSILFKKAAGVSPAKFREISTANIINKKERV